MNIVESADRYEAWLRKQLKDDFVAYLDGFSPNVQEILEKFKFRNQIPTLVEADILGSLIYQALQRVIFLHG